MLWRRGAPRGVPGSSKEVCGVKRAAHLRKVEPAESLVDELSPVAAVYGTLACIR
jgi:hypothetical protein